MAKRNKLRKKNISAVAADLTSNYNVKQNPDGTYAYYVPGDVNKETIAVPQTSIGINSEDFLVNANTGMFGRMSRKRKLLYQQMMRNEALEGNKTAATLAGVAVTKPIGSTTGALGNNTAIIPSNTIVTPGTNTETVITSPGTTGIPPDDDPNKIIEAITEEEVMDEDPTVGLTDEERKQLMLKSAGSIAGTVGGYWVINKYGKRVWKAGISKIKGTPLKGVPNPTVAAKQAVKRTKKLIKVAHKWGKRIIKK